jgi:serine/threonine-protein kinase
MTNRRLVPDVLRITEEALTREGADRDRYLDTACAGDAQLRRDVDAVLARQRESHGFLETPPWTKPAPPLAVGQRLGPYEVTGVLGAGGMGRVYRARDTRLGRTVALKVIAGAGAIDLEARARFIQEAQAVASLNDPHICALHDVGREGDVDFFVMEFVEGETLADRLLRGPLPLTATLEYGAQLADALARAHRQGIVHGDLKPGNVMLTKAGVKLLDFGLARLTWTPAAAGAGDLPGMAGAVVGTVPYMAPELLRGLDSDARTDVFAFGCVVYEMLTGSYVFDGASSSGVATAILHGEPPPLTSRHPRLPPALERLVSRCLAKDPDDRWQSAADLAAELRWLAASKSGEGQTPELAVRADECEGRPPGPLTRDDHRRALQTLAVIGGALLLVGITAVLSRRALAPAPSGAIHRYSLVASSMGLTLTDGGVAVSPDGRTLVFVGSVGGVTRLYRRRFDGSTAEPLGGTEGASAPFFSPDGQWVAYSPPGGGFMKIPVGGGPRQLIWAAGRFEPRRITGACWGPNGIVFGRFPETGLWNVAAENGTPRPLKRPGKAGIWYMWPEVLPGGRAVLFTIWQRGKASIAALSLPAGNVKSLIPSGSRPRYLASGHLVYESEGQLLAVGFDVETLSTHGTTHAVVASVGKGLWAGTWRTSLLGRSYDVSASGTLVYAPPASTLTTLAWKDRRGRTTPLPLEARRYMRPALSSDGARVADTISDGPTRSVWIGRVDGRTMMRLTPGNDDCFSLFTRDDRWVTFTSNVDDRYNIWRIPSDGSGPPQRLTESSHAQRPTSWSPGDKVLLLNDVVDAGTDAGSVDIHRFEDGRESPVVSTAFWEREGAFSPDGRWVAYESNESGRMEVYVKGYPAGPRTKVSLDGGVGPVWNPRGGELFYQGADAVIAVGIVDGRPVGAPVRLFEHIAEFRDWDVTPDGQRFLVVEGGDASASPPQINVVVNWLGELEARVPVRR